MNQINYKLQLSNGQRWEIAGGAEVADWLERFASILEMRKCASNGFNKIRVVRSINEKDAEQLGREGWIGQDHNTFGFCATSDGWLGEKDKSIVLWSHPDKAEIICDIGQEGKEETEFFRMWLSLYPFYLGAIKAGGLPFHAGFAERQGKGVIFAGRGGTGKSTCCRRLPQPWKALSDDEVLITMNKKGDYFAHPLPTWSDHIFKRPIRRNCKVEKSVPLSGIFFIKRSENDAVIPLNAGEASIRIFESAQQVCTKNWKSAEKEGNARLKQRMFNNAVQIAKKAPSYLLRVSLTGKFWEKIERVI